MAIILRKGQPADAEACAIICYEAFKHISAQHHFPPDFPDTAAATGLMNFLLSGNRIYAVVAEVDGKIAGSNFLWEETLVAGVGPITINPQLQNSGIGKKLMEDVLQRAEENNMAGVRLVQAAYHSRSLSLYSKLGFDVQEPLSTMNGPAVNTSFTGYKVRKATEADQEACNRLCFAVHGIDRRVELAGAISSGAAEVVEHDGSITGYTTGLGFFGHSVAASNTALKALIGAAPAFNGPGFLLPTRNAEVLRWCLNNGLQIIQPMSLMTKGLYNEPRGAFLPSILY
jgi:predicted N-acetyltransferase YhbS